MLKFPLKLHLTQYHSNLFSLNVVKVFFTGRISHSLCIDILVLRIFLHAIPQCTFDLISTSMRAWVLLIRWDTG